MGLFNTTVTVKSKFSMEQAISILKRNIEPWHKDGSKLMFEGIVNNDGLFTAQVAAVNVNFGKSRSSGIIFKGAVASDSSNGSTMTLTFSMPRTIITITLFLSLIIMTFGGLILSGVINVDNSLMMGIVAILWPIIYIIILQISFQLQVRKVYKIITGLLTE
jgi:hypothetical protein